MGAITDVHEISKIGQALAGAPVNLYTEAAADAKAVYILFFGSMLSLEIRKGAYDWSIEWAPLTAKTRIDS